MVILPFTRLLGFVGSLFWLNYVSVVVLILVSQPQRRSISFLFIEKRMI